MGGYWLETGNRRVANKRNKAKMSGDRRKVLRSWSEFLPVGPVLLRREDWSTSCPIRTNNSAAFMAVDSHEIEF